MRRIVCLLVVLLFCVTLVAPAYAAGNTFVPSIEYKDGTDVENAEQNGENVTGCLVVTSLKEAKEKTTDIYQEDRDLLQSIYARLANGSMTLPMEEKGYVIRELVDVSYMKEDCVEPPHGHKEWLSEEGNTVEVTFDLDVNADENVVVFVYLNDEWVAVTNVVNNGDGTVTCVFEEICPVVFCVETDENTPSTGDAIRANLIWWIVLLVASLVAIVVVVANRRKFFR